MKRKFKVFLLFILLILPIYAEGTGSSFNLSCPTSVNSNEEFTCSISVNSSNDITSYSADINLEGITLVSGNNSISGSSAKSGEEVAKIVLKANTIGKVSLNNSKINGEKVNDTSVSVSISESKKEEITNIFVNGSSINFSPSKKEYNLTLTSTTGEFKVTAESSGAVNYKSSNGNNNVLNLNPGEKGTITVFTDNVSYKVTIIRKDERSSDNTLKSLKIGDEEIKLEEDTKEYKVSFPNKTKKVKVTAQANNSKAKIEGAKEYDLVVGENKITIVVTAENNEERTYTIIVTRKEIVDTKGEDNLKSLTVNDVKIKKITSNIFVSISNDNDKLKLEYDLLDEDSDVKYDEDLQLKTGINKVKVRINDSNDKETEYNLIIFKEESKNIVDNDEDEIIEALLDGDVTVKLDAKDDKIVSKEILKNLNGNKITYEVLTDNDMILYAITFGGKKFESYNRDINFELAFDTKKNILKNDNYFNIRFINDIVLPTKVNIKIFLKNKFSESDGLYLYNYDGSKELKLIDDSLRKKDYYVSFDINHLGEYVLNNDEILVKKGISIIITIIGLIALLVVGGVIIFFVKKKKKHSKKEKNKKTPSTNQDSEINDENNVDTDNYKEFSNENNADSPSVDDEFSDLIDNNYRDDSEL